MKQRPRIYYSGAQKELMWDRWQKGDSMRTIAGLFDRGHASVQRILAFKRKWLEPDFYPVLISVCL